MHITRLNGLGLAAAGPLAGHLNEYAGFGARDRRALFERRHRG